ncbi:MAG: 2-C-methyl-D-erythritol 4-phosphate cytidylyltransferase [Thiobacillus sp.]|jgi:2-C-methyl-D-erythritol 4-phosphate cytidylyltransferase|uniref:2-C-methyl-D-erythritol 4-phosphate cytidylyltransferase n=1 Tax=Thiobacillus sp. TaxID=924 RepID=UPI002893DDEC|nr:2-C-methyl-D-erythritol 4-phosphate cytidylyltransferase [Thiobacillus sp.]MDT3707425.1 2-C-methyl-D-erythritol 4-phosphate cytidylyltransferase [Thiobacillus sp.]
MSGFHALIPAAGSGSRMRSARPKQYLELNGLPVIAHTLAALSRDARVDRLVVVLSPDDMEWDSHDWSAWQDRLLVLRCGGATRAETVLNGLGAMAEWCVADDWVLVHDAARPCLPGDALARLLDEAAQDAVGGLLAVPVADTLKRADAEFRVEATVPRTGLWQAQTPQMFRHGVLRDALRAAGADMTDEASAIEQRGLRPRLVECDSRNLKVTYPQDLRLASLILEHLND